MLVELMEDVKKIRYEISDFGISGTLYLNLLIVLRLRAEP